MCCSRTETLYLLLWFTILLKSCADSNTLCMFNKAQWCYAHMFDLTWAKALYLSFDL